MTVDSGGRRTGLTLLLGLAACGGSPTAAGADVVTAPTAPAPPALECVLGWRPVTKGTDPPVCEPWPVAGPTACAQGSMQLPGESECGEVGSACPAGDYAEDLPATGVIYVRAGAAGGDGSANLPFGSIAEAAAVASQGDLVALAQGTYDEPVVLGDGVELRGVCASKTVVTSTGGPSSTALVELGDGSALHDVTVEGGSGVGVRTRSDAMATTERIIVEGSPVNGLRLGSRSTLNARDVLVQRCGSLGNLESAAVLVPGGASLNLDRAVISNNVGDALLVRDGGTATLSTVAISDHRGTEHALADELGAGVGLHAYEGGRIEATACVVERSERAAAESFGEGSRIEIEATVLRDTRPEPGGSRNGVGAFIHGSAELVLRNTLLERLSRGGVRTLVGHIELSDVVVRDVESQVDTGEGGYGLQLGTSSTATLARAAFLRTRHAGIVVRLESELSADDLIVSDVQSREPTGVAGQGIAVELGSQVAVRRAIVERTRESGIALHGASVVGTFEDVIVRQGAGRQSDGMLGAGITVFNAQATLSRVLIDDNPRVGLWVGHSGTVTADNLRIRQTRAEDCSDAICRFGVGLGTYQFGRSQLLRFAIEESALCGLQLATEGEVDLQQGTVRRSRIGACIQNDGYDVARLSEQVGYVDNESNLQSVTLPIPDATPPL